jgi:hypothetical protein
VRLPDFTSSANVSALAGSAGGRYPHLARADVPVWEAFLATRLIKFSRIYYDVGVGGKAARHLPQDAELRPMWKTLVRKRIDVVGIADGSDWCIEVKPTAGMSALGQALTYRQLYASEGRGAQTARAVVICAHVDDDVEEVFLTFGVCVVVVAMPDSPEYPSVLKVLGRLR